MNYVISVKTGDQTGAGTDSNIFLKMIGTRGVSEEIRMNDRISGNAFERNNLDSFLYSADIGWVYQIQVRSDTEYSGSDWLLDYIDVTSMDGDPRAGSLPEDKVLQARFSHTGWINNTAPITIDRYQARLDAVGPREYSVHVDYAELDNNYYNSSALERQTTTVTTDTARILSSLEEYEESKKTGSIGINVSGEVSASLPIKKIQAAAKRSLTLTGSYQSEAAENMRKSELAETTRKYEQVTVEVERVKPNTFQLRQHTVVYDAGLMSYTDGIGAVSFLYMRGASSNSESRTVYEFPTDQGKVSLASYKTFKQVYLMRASQIQKQDLANFEALAKEKGWIKGL